MQRSFMIYRRSAWSHEQALTVTIYAPASMPQTRRTFFQDERNNTTVESSVQQTSYLLSHDLALAL